MMASQPAAAKSKTIRFKVIETSDVHGHFFPYDFMERKPIKGTLVRANTYINKERVHAEVNERIFPDDSDANDPSETLQSNNLESSYRAILANMPEKRREVFLASRYDGLKYAEIANKMGLSQKTVEAHMSAAIKQLREGLKEYI